MGNGYYKSEIGVGEANGYCKPGLVPREGHGYYKQGIGGGEANG